MKRSLLMTAGVFLVFTSAVLGQGELGRYEYETFSFDFVGGGARAEGMGKAFLALSDDITGGSWNPAGIYLHEKPVLGVSWASLAPRGVSNTTFSTFVETDHAGSFNTVGSFSFLAPIRIKGHPFVGSFSYTRNFDVFESLEWNYWELRPWVYITPIGVYYDTLLVEQNGVTEFQGGLNSVNFAFGTRLYQNFSFGVSVNVYAGEAVREVTQTTLIHDLHWGYAQFGLYEENVTILDTNKFSGFNFTVGFKYNGDKWKTGLVVRTPFSLNLKFDQSIFVISEFNDLVSEDGTDTLYIGNNLTKYDVPLIVGAGVAYNLTDNFLVAADAEYRRFSGSKVKIRESILINPGGTNEETFTEIDPNWNNVFTFRLGGEYLWETAIGGIPLRGGFGYVPIPAPSVSLSGDTSSVVQRNISAGSGIHWEQIHLDVAYTYSTYSREFDYLHVGINSENKNRNHHLNFSFTGVF